MTLLLTLNPDKITEDQSSDWSKRFAVRTIVENQEGKIGILYVSKLNYYKLPGGGIKVNEDHKQALTRECLEELGINIEIGAYIGSIIEFRTRFKMIQTSFAYLSKTNSVPVQPSFTKNEIRQGFQTLWVLPKEAIRLIALTKTTDYEGNFIIKRDICFLQTAYKNKKPAVAGL